LQPFELEKYCSDTKYTYNIPKGDYMEFSCEFCNHIISVPESAIGKRAKCPKCNKVVVIKQVAVENIELLEDDKVKAFVGEYKPKHYLLNPEEKIAVGPLDLPVHCFEHKREQAQGMINAKKVILDIAKEFEKLSGRKYAYFEEYKLKDAEVAIVIINSTAGTAKTVVDSLREKGVKAGLLKIRVFRPFPEEEIAEALKHIKALAVMDKAEGFSAAGGPLGADIKSALYGRAEGIKVVNFIYGLGGRDVKADDIEKVYNDLLFILKTDKVGETYRYVGVRE
jgi:pyruvate ferredoxin oxidoreductase alpha subunit